MNDVERRINQAHALNHSIAYLKVQRDNLTAERDALSSEVTRLRAMLERAADTFVDTGRTLRFLKQNIAALVMDTAEAEIREALREG